MRTKRMWSFGRMAAVTLAAVVIAMLALMGEARAPVEEMGWDIPEITESPARAAAEAEKRVLPGCRIVQTMGFSRCGHSVTRRISAPEGVEGLSFDGAQAYYSLWRIEEFSPEEIVMTRELPLFCPMHVVLSADDAGEIVLSQNRYGDGMAVLRSFGISLDGFDDETREALGLGLGFDSEEDAEAWLAAH